MRSSDIRCAILIASFLGFMFLTTAEASDPTPQPTIGPPTPPPVPTATARPEVSPPPRDPFGNPGADQSIKHEVEEALAAPFYVPAPVIPVPAPPVELLVGQSVAVHPFIAKSVPSLPQVDGRIPLVEVWRSGATSPQRLALHGHLWERAYITGADPILVRMQFDLAAAGQPVALTPGDGVAIDSTTGVVQVGPTGECTVTVALDADVQSGKVSFYCEGFTGALRFSRTRPEVVASLETPPEQPGPAEISFPTPQPTTTPPPAFVP